MTGRGMDVVILNLQQHAVSSQASERFFGKCVKDDVITTYCKLS